MRRGILCILLAGVSAAGCDGNTECGPGAAPAAGVALTIERGQLDYGDFRSSANNDCTPAGAEVTSLTIDGVQVGGTSFLTFCVPRPDRMGGAAVALGLSDDDVVRLVTVSGASDGCTLSLRRDEPPSATIQFHGYCDAGSHAAGYAISLVGTVEVDVACPSTPAAAATATLAGTAVVEAR
jgi:hypothetical protein